MSQRTALLRLDSFRGGLNDTHPPHRLGDDQLTVAAEVELTPSGGIARRSGVARASAQPAILDFRLLHRHTPSEALSSTEVWAMPISATDFYRSASGTTWSAVSVGADTGSALPPSDAVSFNGKLFVAYQKSAGRERLNVWDGTSIRRAGISVPPAPAVSSTGSGSYPSTLRYYKVQFYRTVGSKVTFSDLSDEIPYTPSGTGTAARITKPSTIDGATGWRVWASADNVLYNMIASNPVATTTVDDSANPYTYIDTNPGIIAPDAGAYTPPWSAKYLLVDENRLLIASAWDTSRYTNRVAWSSILGTAQAGYGESDQVNDDERFPPDQFIDLDTDEGGDITGMETLNGSVYVFKRYAIYKLVRTGNIDVAYKPVVITKVVGAISRRSIVPGEDEGGNPCLYFLSERGPYRFGVSGLQYIGGDIETLWSLVSKRGWTAPPHGLYDAPRGQVRWWVPRTDYGNTGLAPDCQIVFHVRLGSSRLAGHDGRVTGGWTTSLSTTKPNYLASSAMLPDSLTNRDSVLTPYGLHYTGAFYYPPVLWKIRGGQASDDTVHTTTGAITGTEPFTPTVTTKTFSLGLGDKGGVRDVYVACLPSAGGTTLSASLTRDFGVETRTKTQAYTGTTTRAPQQIADLTMAEAQYISLTLSSATQADWTIDDVALRVSREEPV